MNWYERKYRTEQIEAIMVWLEESNPSKNEVRHMLEKFFDHTCKKQVEATFDKLRDEPDIWLTHEPGKAFLVGQQILDARPEWKDD